MDFYHKPVLLDEVISYLAIKPGGVYVDCTVGGGGHSEAILNIDPDIQLIGIDQDAIALSAAQKRLQPYSERIKFVHSNFSQLINVLQTVGVEQVDGILMDIGVSSHQLDEPDRGFSYQHDAPLDMRMNREQTLSAYQLVNELSEKDLSKIIYDYGEERWAARIAQFIIDRRKNSPIKTTGELVEIIKAAIPAKARQDGSHPAKRTFQALRIAVNEELTVLEEGIHQAIECLLPGGRLVVITFHSLEDRIVKNIFKEESQDCVCPPSFPVCTCEHEAKVKIVTKRPVTASQTELEENHRSRSAKLRAVERLSKGVKK